MTATAQPFALKDLTGETRRHPTDRPSLIAFVKEDCQTCNLVAPLLEAFHRAWGETADIWMLRDPRWRRAVGPGKRPGCRDNLSSGFAGA
jgi:thiol-disulfide isomerase/thioredoxin